MSNLAIEALVVKRQELITEKEIMQQKFNAEISEIETAIEQLSGKKVWETKEGEKEVTRLEVIDETGRILVKYNQEVELSYQDDGRTLKVFIKSKNKKS